MMQAARVALVAVVLVAAGCAQAETPVEAVTPVELSARELAVDQRSPVVGIEALGCGLTASIGSGVGFPDDGIVLTTAHTVAGATEINVIDIAGQSRSAAVAYFDPTKDIAALAVAGLAGQQLSIGTGTTNSSAAVVSWRRPSPGAAREFEHIAGSLSRRLIVTIEDIWVQGSYERTALEIATETEPIVAGDSGAPVIDEAGAVIGMVYGASRSRGAGFALDHAELRAALQGAAAAAGSAPIDTGRCI